MPLPHILTKNVVGGEGKRYLSLSKFVNCDCPILISRTICVLVWVKGHLLKPHKDDVLRRKACLDLLSSFIVVPKIDVIVGWVFSFIAWSLCLIAGWVFNLQSSFYSRVGLCHLVCLLCFIVLDGL